MPERGCDMSTTTQERLETAVKNLEQYGEDLDAKGELPSGEDLAELKNRMKEVKPRSRTRPRPVAPLRTLRLSSPSSPAVAPRRSRPRA
jgi:hypothetical protein